MPPKLKSLCKRSCEDLYSQVDENSLKEVIEQLTCENLELQRVLDDEREQRIKELCVRKESSSCLSDMVGGGRGQDKDEAVEERDWVPDCSSEVRHKQTLYELELGQKELDEMRAALEEA